MYWSCHVDADTYTAQASVGDVNKAIANHKVLSWSPFDSTWLFMVMSQNLESNETALLAFGNGDGGGGPLVKMLENVSGALWSWYMMIDGTHV